MKLTVAQLDLISGHIKYAKRKSSLSDVLEGFPEILGRPHQMAQFMAQVMHESSGLRFPKELWGPTAAQRRYEGRKDLGNVNAGDGRRFSGRGYIQVTGRANYRSFTSWMQDRDRKFPDFEAYPERLETSIYLGMGAVWYWSQRVPARYVDEGNIEMVTRRVNGGLNGYADRLRYYDRAALVLLGFGPLEVSKFQSYDGIEVDGVSGPVTRGRMHAALKSLALKDPISNAPTLPVSCSIPPRPRSGVSGFLKFIFGERK
jgi:putative chitinase